MEPLLGSALVCGGCTLACECVAGFYANPRLDPGRSEAAQRFARFYGVLTPVSYVLTVLLTSSMAYFDDGPHALVAGVSAILWVAALVHAVVLPTRIHTLDQFPDYDQLHARFQPREASRLALLVLALLMLGAAAAL